MKKLLIGIATATLAITALPGAASAQPWQSVNARQDRLYNRIEQGVRSGQISRREAAGLRNRFVSLARLENQYRRSGGGLSGRERIDLDRRFDQLSQAIRWERRDANRRRG